MISPHVDDIGTSFIVTILDQDDDVIDISIATTKELIFKKPDATVVTKTASFYTNGTNGQLVYVTEDGDLDMHGLWSIQAHIVTASVEYKTSIYEFRVERNVQ